MKGAAASRTSSAISATQTRRAMAVCRVEVSSDTPVCRVLAKPEVVVDLEQREGGLQCYVMLRMRLGNNCDGLVQGYRYTQNPCCSA